MPRPVLESRSSHAQATASRLTRPTRYPPDPWYIAVNAAEDTR
jgi:hypothetical protein